MQIKFYVWGGLGWDVIFRLIFLSSLSFHFLMPPCIEIYIYGEGGIWGGEGFGGGHGEGRTLNTVVHIYLLYLYS